MNRRSFIAALAVLPMAAATARASCQTISYSAIVFPSQREYVSGEWKVTTPYKLRGESLRHATSWGRTVKQAAQMNMAAIDSLISSGTRAYRYSNCRVDRWTIHRVAK